MPSKVSAILRSLRGRDRTLNILTCPTHERYESNLARTGHNFYALRGEHIKDWKTEYAPIPYNYHILENGIPSDVRIDVVLSQHKFGQYQLLSQYAFDYNAPLISLEHTLPMPQWGNRELSQLKQMRGHLNLFISEFSRDKWGWYEHEAKVIHHGIDTALFKPAAIERQPHILSVVNDWINRDIFCGFGIWQRVCNGLPVRPVGDTPGLSKPAANTRELVKEYQTAQVFINTSTVSPVPTALMEAMAAGCAIVTTATCMIPEIVVNGENGFISNDESELREYCRLLLSDQALREKLGANARRTIEQNFSLDKFVNNWNNYLFEAAELAGTL